MIVLGIAVATVASFFASFALYASPPVSALINRTSTPRPGLPIYLQMLSVLIRSLVTACLLGGLLLAANWDGAGAGALLGLALATLPAILLSGAIIHENVPIPTAGVHLLDWIIKLVVTGTIVGMFS